jgi:hypothetical protein
MVNNIKMETGFHGVSHREQFAKVAPKLGTTPVV